MSITVVGSIAYDTVRTPFGERERMLGGAAVHFALAASFFDDVRVVGPVGEDFGDEQLEVIADRADVELRDALASLEAVEREAVIRRVVLEESYRAIAADLRCSEQVVRKRVSRGLARLRESLEGR